MNEVCIENIPKKININFDSKEVQLASKTVDRIEEFWNILSMNSDFNAFRGDIFAIKEVKKSTSELSLDLLLTDYAHYLYSLNNEMDSSEACVIMFTSVIISTTDNFYVFGEMAEHTSSPNRLQCVGGNIDKSDVTRNSIDLLGNIKREIKEEVGLDISIETEIIPKYLKTGGENNFIAVIFEVNTILSSIDFKKMYNNFVKEIQLKNEKPEFREIVFLEKNRKEINDFFKNDSRNKVDYLEPLLKFDVN